MSREPLAVDWQAIEKAVVSGVTFKQAAEAFGVGYNTVRKRALRHKWPTAKAIVRKANQLQGTNVPAVSNDALASVIAVQWLSKAESHRVLAFEMASKALSEAKPECLKDWQSINVADKMARRAAGLDVVDANKAVNVNLQLVNQRLASCNLPADC